jgi:hypothetical protein
MATAIHFWKEGLGVTWKWGGGDGTLHFMQYELSRSCITGLQTGTRATYQMHFIQHRESLFDGGFCAGEASFVCFWAENNLNCFFL